MRWLCPKHRVAGLETDRACCRSAFWATAAVDQRVWYDIRIACKSKEDRLAIALWGSIDTKQAMAKGAARPCVAARWIVFEIEVS